MKLVIGGAYQGKLKIALQLAGAKRSREFVTGRETQTDDRIPSDIVADGERDSLEAAVQRRIVYNLQAYFRRFAELEELEGQEKADCFLQMIFEKNPEAILVMNELGCGIVPVNAIDRRWRELCGRAGQKAAAGADEVVRVVCGLPIWIKGGKT